MEVESDSLLLKKQFIAAMSREMKSPLQKIISLINEEEMPSETRSVEIKDAARYLLSLVDELAHLGQSNQQVKP